MASDKVTEVELSFRPWSVPPFWICCVTMCLGGNYFLHYPFFHIVGFDLFDKTNLIYNYRTMEDYVE